MKKERDGAKGRRIRVVLPAAGLAAALILAGAAGRAQANPLADILAQVECLHAGNEWVEGECVEKDPPPAEDPPLSGQGDKPVEVVLAGKLTTQEIAFDRIGSLCISWPAGGAQLPFWAVYACLLIDGQWWSAQRHYRLDVCGPAGIAFLPGLAPLKQAIGETAIDAFGNVGREHLEAARIFVGVLNLVDNSRAYLRELVLKGGG